MSTDTLPWLEYSGQTASEIIACKETHQVDSLLRALEDGIQLRQSRNGQEGTSVEEVVLLAIRALDREVNNGGYNQFFLNSSHQYTAIIVDACNVIGCEATASVTAKAISALQLADVTAAAVANVMSKRNSERTRLLKACDKRFYRLTEIPPKLFRFVESHEEKFKLEKISVPPRPKQRGSPNIVSIYASLRFAQPIDPSFDAVRRLATAIATQRSIPATESEIDGATYLYLFGRSVHFGDLSACELLAPRAFDLARDDTGHCVNQRKWVEKLIEAANHSLADAVTLQYLEYLNIEDRSSDFIYNRIVFWANLLRLHPVTLRKSIEFFRANFPDVNLDGQVTERSSGR